MNTELIKRKTASAAQTLILDAFARDGVKCDPMAKIYDEEGTAAGGDGNRSAFTKCNNLIIDYHQILKVLTGEKRANIYEDIPVIDFLHPENTGYQNVYRRENGKLYAAAIVPLPSEEDTDPLDLIMKEDKYTINRIINGEPIASYLYNTNSIISADPNIQTSFLDENKISKRYEGIAIKEYIDKEDGEIFKSLRKPNIYYYKFLSQDAAKKAGISLPSFIETTQQNGELSTKRYFLNKIIITLEKANVTKVKLPSDLKYSYITEDSYYGPENNRNFFVKKDKDSEEAKTNTILHITITSEDMFLIIPGDNTNKNPTRFLFFKNVTGYNDPQCGSDKYKLFIADIKDYSINTNTTRLTEISPGSPLPDDLFEGYSNIEKLLSYYIEIDKSYYSYASGLLNGLYSKPLETMYTAQLNSNSIYTWKFLNDYKIAAKEGINIKKGTTYFRGHLIGRGIFYDAPLAPTYHDYASISETYDKTAENSYQLHTATIYDPIGDYVAVTVGNNNKEYYSVGDTIYEYKEDIHKMKEISKTDSFAISSIDSLKNYYTLPGNVKGKAEILLEIIKNSLNGAKIFKPYEISKENWDSFYQSYSTPIVTNVISKLDYSKEEISSSKASELLLDDSSPFWEQWSGLGSWQDTTIPGASNKLRGSLINNPDKFAIRNYNDFNQKRVPGADEIISYFKGLLYTKNPNALEPGETLARRIQTRQKDGKTETVLYIDSNDAGVCSDSFVERRIKNSLSREKAAYSNGNRGNHLTDTPETSIYIKYMHQWKLKKGVYSFRKQFIEGRNDTGLIDFNIVTPMDVFATAAIQTDAAASTITEDKRNSLKNSSEKIILIYPEYPDRVPEKLFIVSAVDLKLQKAGRKEGNKLIPGGMVSFYIPPEGRTWQGNAGLDAGKFISFEVSNVDYFSCSEVNYINVYDEEEKKSTEFSRIYMEPHTHTETKDISESEGRSETTDNGRRPSTYTRTGSTGDPSYLWGETITVHPYDIKSFVKQHPDGSYTNEFSYKIRETYKRSYTTYTAVDTYPELNKKSCYIYELSAVNLFTNSRPFYSQFDTKEETKEINLASGPGKLIFNPLAFPGKAFFTSKKIKTADGLDDVVLAEESRRDVYDLFGSYIISDIPACEKLEDLSNITAGANGPSLHFFRKFIETEVNSNKNTLYKNAFNDVLSDWKLTNSPNNAITLDQLPELLEGLTHLEIPLEDLKRKPFKIKKSKKVIEDTGNDEIKYKIITYKENLSNEEINSLLYRITRKENFDNFEEKYYNLNLDSSDIKFTAEEVNNSKENIFNAKLKSIISSDKINISVDNDNIRGKNRTFSMKRPSLKYMSAILQKIFYFPIDWSNGIPVDQSKELSEEVCRNLDSILGLNTGAILRIGDDASSEFDNEIVDDLTEKVTTAFSEILQKLDKSYKDIKNNTRDYGDKEAEKNKILEEHKEEVDLFIKNKLDKYEKDTILLKEAAEAYNYDISNTEKGFLFDSYLTIPYAYIKENKEYRASTSYVPVWENYEEILKEENFPKNRKETEVLENIKKINIALEKRAKYYQLDRNLIAPDENASEEEKLNYKKSLRQLAIKFIKNNTTSNIIANAEKKFATDLGELSTLSSNDLVEYLFLTDPAKLKSSLYILGLNGKEEIDGDVKKLISTSNKVLSYIYTELLKEIDKEELAAHEAWEEFSTINPKPSETALKEEWLKENGYEYLFVEGTPAQLSELSISTIKNYVSTYLDVDIMEKRENKIKLLNDTAKEVDAPLISPIFTLPIPEYTSKEINGVSYSCAALTPSEENITIKIQDAVKILPIDVRTEVLEGLASFIKTNLDGTDGSDPEEKTGVEYNYKTRKLEGNPNSLYYKRYQYLNNRLHKTNGPLAQVSIITSGVAEANKIKQDYATGLINSYKDIIRVEPIEKMEKLYYLGENSLESIDPHEMHIPGKYCYPAQIDAIKRLAGDQCLLTCTKCAAKHSCPYYNEDTIIKVNCSRVKTIDLWFKDNELDLLYYNTDDEEKALENDSEKLNEKIKDLQEKQEIINSLTGDEKVKIEAEIENLQKEIDEETLILNEEKEKVLSPYLTCDNFRIKKEVFQETHNQYADIVRKSDEVYKNTIPIEDDIYKDSSGNFQKVEGLRTKIKEKFASHFKDTRDSLGFLVGARYGTVEKNMVKTLFSAANPELNSLPDYNYLYDAIHLLDEESSFNYRKSTYKYDVSIDGYNPDPFDKTPKHFSGNTYIKIPESLKLLSEAKGKDDVYLVSDDYKDPDGNIIEPVIYLGKVKNVRKLCRFDLMETAEKNSVGETKSINSSSYYNYYPVDVAQWSVNYIKGNLLDTPLNTVREDEGNFSNPDKDGVPAPKLEGELSKKLFSLNENRDQFWMKEIKKKVTTIENGKLKKSWLTLPGRSRSASKYQEAVMNSEGLNKDLIISGKPVVNKYFNFIRRMSIQIWDDDLKDGEGDWTIPWVNPELNPPTLNYQVERISPIDKQKKIMIDVSLAEYKRTILPFMKTNLRLVVVKSKS